MTLRPCCRCGCGAMVPRARAVYLNEAHMMACWRRSDEKRRIALANVPAATRTRRRKALAKALEVTGLTLTDRELQLYTRAYFRGYAAGHMKGKDSGYRNGWAEALGERTTRRRRTEAA